MELKVWVDGVQRVVCGLAERTTCQEVIYALAHATQRTGRFVLVEKFRKTERSLSPHDRPLELLSKWGEYASDVQFVLRCLEDTTPTSVLASSNMQQQQQRPSSALQQQRAKTMNGTTPENHVTNRYRRMNNSMDENGCTKMADLSPTNVMIATQNGTRNGSPAAVNNGGIDSTSSSNCNNHNQERILNGNTSSSSTMVTPTTAHGTVLKPYFVDTSLPTPESGTLIRPTAFAQQQQPASYEATPQQNFPVRRTGTLSPVPAAPVQQQSVPYFTGGAPVQRSTTPAMMACNGGSGGGTDNNARRLQAAGGGSLTVLSQSAHESLANTTTTSSFDSSGATLYLESSYASSNNAAQPMASSGKNLDLSQTSYCSSSISSTASGSVQSQQHPRMNGARPPPPSYDAFVQMHKRNQVLMANRNGQASPAPVLVGGQGMVAGRSRTPVVPTMEQRPPGNGSMSREQLIRLIESQQYQIQAQCQTMRSYDAEIAQRESTDRSIHAQTPIIDHLRRELQQLEVERVHVKQKVEELRRQDLDTQLATLRQTLAETLLESVKLDEKLKSMDAQMIMNEEKIRSISNELERERGEILNLTAPSSVGSSLNDSLLASNEAFEARIRSLDEMLREKRKQLDSAAPGSPMKSVRARSFGESNVQQVELAGQQRPTENASGVWV